jgi:predicted DNA-binding protein
MGLKETAERERVQVRMPEELKRRLLWSAAKSGRTLNGEILSRVIESFGDAIALPVAELPDRPLSIEERVSALEKTVGRLTELIGN